MLHHRRLLACAIGAIALALATSCSPAPFALSSALAPLPPPPTHPADCGAAIAMVWPPQLQAKARRIAWRESRNAPTAQNGRSTAAGCFQLLRLHAGRFAKYGWSWNHDRYDALINTQVAFDLFLDQGWAPWALTA